MTPGLELETEPASVPNEGQSTIQDQPAGDPTYFNELYGPRLEKLPMQLVNAIKGVVQEFQQQEKYLRRREVMRDRRNRFYERGVQHLYESTQGLTPMVPGQIYSGANGRGQAPTYIDDYNIFLPYERIILSVLTQNAPGIAFRPSNPNYEPDCEAADVAENYAKLYDRANDVKGLQVEQIRMMALSGRTISWTRTEADAQMFGYNEDGSPKRQEVTSFYGTLESKVPVMAKSQKDCLYCILYDDPDVKQARAEYPGEGADGVPFAKKIQAGGVGLGENEYERTARLGILQGTRSQAQQGDAFTHVTTRMRCFLRPASFSGEKFDEPFTEADESMADENGEPPSVKDILAQIYPEGALVTFVGDDYVGSGNGSMDDAIDIAFPYKGDGMSRQAIMDLFVVIQDTFNDVTNGLRQASDVGWPSTWVDGEDQDYDAIAGQKADPYAIRVRKARKDLAMAASFFREPDLVLPDSLMRWIENISGPLAQLMLATPPVLFGAGDSDAKTASGTAQLRSQAMGQLGLIWGMIQRQWARIRYQAALLAGKNPDYAEEVVVATGDETAPIQMSKLMKGKFGAYPDQDSSFPETTAQKRQNLNALIQLAAQSPEFGAQLMSSPDNWKTISELQGFSEIVILEAESRDKQLLEIEQLLQQQPIPPSPEEIEAAQMAEATEAVKNAAIEAQTGVAPPAPKPFDPVSLMKSSVTVEELDFHAWEFAKCQQWLSSDACRRQLAIRSEQYPAGNILGVMNVRLHAMEHRAYMQAAQAAQAPPEEGPPAKRTMQDQPKDGQPPPAPNAAPTAPAPIA